MKHLGQYLWEKFLETNWVCDETTVIAHSSAMEAAEAFWDSASAISDAAKSVGYVWSEDAVSQLDDALKRFAESGETEMNLKLSPEGAVELWRRWEYTIVALMLEDKARTSFSIPYPQGAPELISGSAVALYLLGGPGRDYPMEMFAKKPER